MADVSIDELFAATLVGDYDDEKQWAAVRTLQRMGTREVFDVAAQWCKAADPLKRARGLDVLAQLGKTAEHPTNAFQEEAYAIVAGVVERETEVLPLSAGIGALGHLDNASAVPLICRFSTHDDAGIRFHVACAIGSFHEEELSTQSLLTLMDDPDEDVRDWATFGLGNLGDRDNPEIREALLRRLSDSFEDTREEAMVGLAKRRDQRVLPALRDALNREKLKDRVAEAASLLLGMETDPPDWGAEEYRAALDERFPN